MPSISMWINTCKKKAWRLHSIATVDHNKRQGACRYYKSYSIPLKPYIKGITHLVEKCKSKPYITSSAKQAIHTIKTSNI